MPSPLYNTFGGSPLGNPTLNNIKGLMQRFNQFKNTFSGNPQQQVQQLLNSGKMSQAQFNQLKAMADQFQKFM